MTFSCISKWRIQKVYTSFIFFALAGPRSHPLATRMGRSQRLRRILTNIINLLRRPRERWRSTVMSTSVCVSVCVSVREDISGTTPATAILTKFFMHIAYGRGSVLLRLGDDITCGRGNFVFFSVTDNVLYSIVFRTHTKRLNRSRCRLGRWLEWTLCRPTMR